MKVSIECPKCKKFLTEAEFDNKVHKLACRNCWKWIWFKTDGSMKPEIHDIPERETNSGLRFY